MGTNQKSIIVVYTVGACIQSRLAFDTATMTVTPFPCQSEMPGVSSLVRRMANVAQQISGFSLDGLAFMHASSLMAGDMSFIDTD